MKVLILSANRFEDSELRVPLERLRDKDVEVDIASLRVGTITGKHGYQVEAGRTLQQVDPNDYALLIIPGGKAPSELRKHYAALAIVKSFFVQNKPVAAISHGPKLLVAAGIMKNRRGTCYRTVARELEEAGAIREDREVVVDGNLITSRQPSDLHAFMRQITKALREAAPRDWHETNEEHRTRSFSTQ